MLPPQLLIQFHYLLFLKIEPLKVNSVVNQTLVNVIGVDCQDGFDLGFLAKPRGVNVSDALKHFLEKVKLFRVILLEQDRLKVLYLFLLVFLSFLEVKKVRPVIGPLLNVRLQDFLELVSELILEFKQVELVVIFD